MPCDRKGGDTYCVHCRCTYEGCGGLAGEERELCDAHEAVVGDSGTLLLTGGSKAGDRLLATIDGMMVTSWPDPDKAASSSKHDAIEQWMRSSGKTLDAEAATWILEETPTSSKGFVATKDAEAPVREEEIWTRPSELDDWEDAGEELADLLQIEKLKDGFTTVELAWGSDINLAPI